MKPTNFECFCILVSAAAGALTACSPTRSNHRSDDVQASTSNEHIGVRDRVVPARVSGTTTPRAPSNKQSVIIKGFSCGDNCYLDYDNKGRRSSTLCRAKPCSQWARKGELPRELVDRHATISLSMGNQFDGDGNVMASGVPVIERVEVDGRQPAVIEPTKSDNPFPVLEVGKCVETRISLTGPRLKNAPGSGVTVVYQNGLRQVSYDLLAGVVNSKPGDPVRLCVVELPKNCPADDTRGIIYRAHNLRTEQDWTASDSQHSCGGA